MLQIIKIWHKTIKKVPLLLKVDVQIHVYSYSVSNTKHVCSEVLYTRVIHTCTSHVHIFTHRKHSKKQVQKIDLKHNNTLKRSNQTTMQGNNSLKMTLKY